MIFHLTDNLSGSAKTMKGVLKKIIVAIIQAEAKLVLKKYKPKIIAVTGSVGKTSTKDAIYAILSEFFFVRKSSKSFNSDVGVPLTILGLPNAWNDPILWFNNIIDAFNLILFPHKYPEWLIIEVGADRPGDIRAIAGWLKPDMSVVTRMSEVPVHVEFFDSAEQVRQEKAELVIGTNPKGIVILNADDKLVSSMRALFKGRVVTFGTTNSATVVGENFKIDYSQTIPSFPTGVSFGIRTEGHTLPIKITGSLGRQHMFSGIAAFSVAVALGLDLQKAATALSEHRSPPGRMKILAGIHDICIIDDSYNSSPVAAHEALETLSMIRVSGRKIAMLGDMLELGDYSKTEHEKLGLKVAKVADELYAVGLRSQDIYAKAKSAGFPEAQTHWFKDSVEARDHVRSHLRSGDVVLIKGSQGIRMEKVVAGLMARPDEAKTSLVRQDEEWAKR